MDQSAVTSAGKAYIPQAVEVLSEAFQEDPVITYLLNSLSPEARIAYLPAYFNALLTAATLNKAKITEINGWKCCGVLVPPGEKVDNPRTWLQAGLIPFLWNMGLRGARKTLLEYTPISDRAKAKAMKPGEKFYYVFFMDTRNGSRKQGLASKVIKHYQDISSAENLPLWLEATTAFSKDLYLKLGFEIVQEMVLGPDTTAPSGLPLKGGDGVKIWGMIWRAPS